jgi:hypothetical protein
MTSAAPGGAPDLASLLESIGLGRTRAPHSNDVGAAPCRAIRTVGELCVFPEEESSC